MQKVLDGIERLGNRVPHPAVMFLIMIGALIVLSHAMYLMGTAVSYQVIDVATHEIVIKQLFFCKSG